MRESHEFPEVTEGGECAFLALLNGVLDPDPDRGINGQFAVFSQDGQHAAIAFPFTPPGVEAPVLQLHDFYLPWAVGSLTTGGKTVGFAWRYTDLCIAVNETVLRVELDMPPSAESLPLYLPAFRIDAPFPSDECHVVHLDVSQPLFRACGYARSGTNLRPLLWTRDASPHNPLVARDLSELLSLEVRQGFEGALGFLEDGRLEIAGTGAAQTDVLIL